MRLDKRNQLIEPKSSKYELRSKTKPTPTISPLMVEAQASDPPTRKEIRMSEEKAETSKSKTKPEEHKPEKRNTFPEKHTDVPTGGDGGA